MHNIGFTKCIARVVGLSVFALAAMGTVAASAQTVSALQYQKINGQIYAYELSNPASMYLVSNPTPEQIGLGENAEAKGKELLNADSKGRALGVFPYNPNRRAYDFPYTQAPIPARVAESNSALPAVTFRNSSVSSQNQAKTNSIGGLPRYPGKNYSPGDNVSP